MDLTSFAERLQALVGRPTILRPFVCDGSPLDCKVFIVGFNPATEMAGDWWDFWNPQTGFDRHAWLVRYRAERASQPLKLGRTRRAPISNTRRVIDWIVEAARPVKCLETNIYSAASASIADLDTARRTTEVFDFLLDSIRPAVIVAHGKDAGQHVTDRLRAAPHRPQLLTVDHLSRGWSQERAITLGRELRDLLAPK